MGRHAGTMKVSNTLVNLTFCHRPTRISAPLTDSSHNSTTSTIGITLQSIRSMHASAGIEDGNATPTKVTRCTRNSVLLWWMNSTIPTGWTKTISGPGDTYALCSGLTKFQTPYMNVDKFVFDFLVSVMLTDTCPRLGTGCTLYTRELG